MVRKGMNKLTMSSGSSIQTDVLCSVELVEVTATEIAVIEATMMMMHKTKVKMKLWTPTAAMMRRSMTMTSCTRRGVHCSAEVEEAAVDREATEEIEATEAMEVTEAMIPKKILMVARMVVVVVEAVVAVAVAAEVVVEVEAMASSVEMPTSLSLLKTS